MSFFSFFFSSCASFEVIEKRRVVSRVKEISRCDGIVSYENSKTLHGMNTIRALSLDTLFQKLNASTTFLVLRGLTDCGNSFEVLGM